MARSPDPRTPHARPAWSGCPICGGDHLARSHPRRPWSPGELLAAGFCAGVLTFALAELLARWLA